jgi:hypothetical protein
MNQGTQGYSLMKKTEGRKSRDTVSLKSRLEYLEHDPGYRISATKIMEIQKLINIPFLRNQRS